MKITHARILRSFGYDCTNNGLSSRRNYVYVFDDCTLDEAVARCKEDDIDIGDCLWADHSPSCSREYLKLVPLERKREGYVGPMFGGNFAWTWDRAFPHYSAMKETRLPIPIHDRYETPEEYDLLSR